MPSRTTIDNLKGMGNAQASGEYFYSEHMKAGQFGLEASRYLASLTASSSPPALTWLVEFLNAPWGVGTDGKLYKESSNDFVLGHTNTQASIGNGLLVDQTGRLLYAGNQYLGKTSDGSSFTDNWKDFGASLTDYRPGDTYEDWAVFGNGNKVAVLNITDDSWNDNAFELPSGFRIKCLKSNCNGILLGANQGNRGVLVLWKVGITRSLSEWIWLDSPIQSICKASDGWVVTTAEEQYLTDGYTLTQKLPTLPDTVLGTQPHSVIPAGTLYANGRLLTANSDVAGRYNRHKTGLWILDLSTRLYDFVPPSNGQVTDMTMAALFRSSAGRILSSFLSTNPSNLAKICELREDISPRAVLVAGPFGPEAAKKVAIGVELGLSIIPTISTTQKTKSFTVTAKIANLKRTLWAYAVTSATADSDATVKVNGQAGGFSNAKVGDEVTVLSGSYAGTVAHITAIASEDQATEIWTLDKSFSGAMPSGVTLQVMPFQLIAAKTVSFSTLEELESIYFNIKNRIKGSRYLLKFVFSDISSFPFSVDHVSLDFEEKKGRT